MDKKKGCVVGSGIIVTFVILSVLAIGYFNFGGGEKITERVQGNENQIENTQKKEISLLHIENLGDSLDSLGSKVNNHAILNWSLLVIIFIIMFSFCAHYHLIRMPRKIQDNFLKGQQEDKLQECESALVDMGYLRKKPNKQTNKKHTEETNKD